jgi:hypothetical protein
VFFPYKVLQDHRTECQQQGKYKEAAIAQQRLEDLKNHLETQRKETLQNRQRKERLGAEEAHMLELTVFNLKWDEKMGTYNKQAER